jgi:hypothetical protein
MYDESASALRARLRLLHAEVSGSALSQLEEHVPRGSRLDLTGIRRPLTLNNIEWVTAAFLDMRVSDVHWSADHPLGTIEDLMIGGRVVGSSGHRAGELKGRVTLGLAELTATQLCEVLEVVEWMQPLQRIESTLPRRNRADIPATLLYRRGAPFLEVNSVAWDCRSSAHTFQGLYVCSTDSPGRRWRLADSFYFDTCALNSIADALNASNS